MTSRKVRKLIRILKQIFHKPRVQISREGSILTVSLLLTFFAALIVRLFPVLVAQPVVKAFDPWFQLKITQHVVENGFQSFFNWFDTSVWYPWGRDIAKTTYPGIPFTTALLYELLQWMGINVELVYVAIIMPAVMGAFATIAMYYLAKEVSNNTTAIFAAIILALSPAYLQRTISGFFDNEAIGVLLIIIIFYFFVRSLKRGSIISGILAGLSLGALSASWGASSYPIGILPLFAFTMLLIGRSNARLLTSYLTTITVGLFVSMATPRVGIRLLSSTTGLLAIGVGALLLFVEFYKRFGESGIKFAKKIVYLFKPAIIGGIAALISIVAFLSYTNSMDVLEHSLASDVFFGRIGSKFLTIIDPFYRLSNRILGSVAENAPSPWSAFFAHLYVFTIIFPLGFYFLYKRRRDEDIFVLIFGLSTLYFAGSMIRLLLVLAPAVALLSAIAISNILIPYARALGKTPILTRRRGRIGETLTSEHAAVVFAFVGLVISISFIQATTYTATALVTPEFAPKGFTDWQQAMTFLRDEVSDNDVVASWWDYGYWINVAGGKITVADGGTINSTQIALLGYAFMSTNLTESLKTFKIWNTSYVLVYWGHLQSWAGGDEGKWPWMVRIAEDKLGSNVIDDATYLDNKTGQPTEAYYQSTLFKLLTKGEPWLKDQKTQWSNTSPYDDLNLWDQRGYLDHMYGGIKLYGAFNLVFASPYGFVKIYKINYDMLYQYENASKSDLRSKYDSLSSVSIDGDISDAEIQNTIEYHFQFGNNPYLTGTAYAKNNGTHLYIAISMDNYSAKDSFGIEFGNSLTNPIGTDIHLVNYEGYDNFDGHILSNGTIVQDTQQNGISAYKNGTIEFLIPLNTTDPNDIAMNLAWNYPIRFIRIPGPNSSSVTKLTDWFTLWVATELH